MAKAKAQQAYQVTVKSPLWWDSNVAYPGDVVTHLSVEAAAPLVADGYLVAVEAAVEADQPEVVEEAPVEETPAESDEN